MAAASESLSIAARDVFDYPTPRARALDALSVGLPPLHGIASPLSGGPLKSRRWQGSRHLGDLIPRNPDISRSASFRAPNGYATATLAPSKGRLMHCPMD